MTCLLRIVDRRPTRWLLIVAVVVLLTSNSAFAQDDQGQAATGGRQQIVTNQFTSTTGGSIGARRPGLWVQQGIAEHRGDMPLSGVEEEPPNFFKDTFDQISMSLLGVLSGLLDGINALISNFSGSGSSTPGQAAFIPISNATTTGQGTTVQIE